MLSQSFQSTLPCTGTLSLSHVHFLASASRRCVPKSKHVAHSAIKYCPNATAIDDPLFKGLYSADRPDRL